MKKIKRLFFFCTFTLLSISYSFGQKEVPELPIDGLTNKITYTAVVYVDSTSKQELYSRASEWFAKAFVSAKNVIQLEDKENGKIIGKAIIEVNWQRMGMTYQGGYIKYTISIYVKDGRYKYEITDLYHKGTFTGSYTVPDYGACEEMINTDSKSWGQSRQKEFNYYLSGADNEIKSLINTLKLAMMARAKNTKDW